MVLKGRPKFESKFNADGTVSVSNPPRKLTTGSSKNLMKQRKTQSLRNKHHSGGGNTMKGVMRLVRKAKTQGSSFSGKTPKDRANFKTTTFAYSSGGASRRRRRRTRRQRRTRRRR